MKSRSNHKSAWIAKFLTRSAVVSMLLGASIQVTAQDRSKLDDALAKGEFSVAKTILDKSKDKSTRETGMRDLIRAQAEMGAFRQALDSASSSSSPSTFRGGVEDYGGALMGGSGRGGIAQADFDPLIELIQDTISPESWQDTGGGAGRISPFESGVAVDSLGVIRRIPVESRHDSLSKVRDTARADSGNREVAVASKLRKVSLPKLERALALSKARGSDVSTEMQNLAGLTRIEYVFVYPETGDLVIAGPAGDWRTNDEGVDVNIDSGAPVLNLDDLIVCLRNAVREDGKFGCSIDPREANLKATQAFIQTSKPNGSKWNDQLREKLGRQDIIVYGIDPSSHAAKVIVEADYHMKLVGLGLEKSAGAFPSLLDRIGESADGSPQPLDVVRWWFTLNYDSVSTTDDGTGYSFAGTTARVLSENELLSEKGERIHTGKSKDETAQFASDFTKNFSLLAEKHTIYAELRNVFDFAIVSGLIREHGLADQVSWEMDFFVPESPNEMTIEPASLPVPKEVDTVMNSQETTIRRDGKKLKQRITAVSGGVAVDSNQFVSKSKVKTDEQGTISANRKDSRPTEDGNWWWD